MRLARVSSSPAATAGRCASSAVEYFTGTSAAAPSVAGVPSPALILAGSVAHDLHCSDVPHGLSGPGIPQRRADQVHHAQLNGGPGPDHADRVGQAEC